MQRKITASGSLVVLEAEKEEEADGWSPSPYLLKYSSDSLRACLLIVTHGTGERSEKEEERGGCKTRRRNWGDE